MESPNGGDTTPNGHLLSPNEASSTRIGLHLIELLANRNPKTTQAFAKIV